MDEGNTNWYWIWVDDCLGNNYQLFVWDICMGYMYMFVYVCMGYMMYGIYHANPWEKNVIWGVSLQLSGV